MTDPRDRAETSDGVVFILQEEHVRGESTYYSVLRWHDDESGKRWRSVPGSGAYDKRTARRQMNRAAADHERERIAADA